MAYKYTIKGIRKFNEEKVIDKALLIYTSNAVEPEIKVKYHQPSSDEEESYTMMIEGISTQGINIKHLVGGNIIVELPWLAAEMDVKFCYAYLNAIKKVHRTARIMDDKDSCITLSDEDAKEEWKQRWNNMDDILKKGEKLIVAGVTRDFHLSPAKYSSPEYSSNRVDKAFVDFTSVQWSNLDAINIKEEMRHITDEEELSSIRVVDNKADVFIGACHYVGIMSGNTCKMVSFDVFCSLMKNRGEFCLLDAAQALLYTMDEKEWEDIFSKAEGIIKYNFRKTFIMRWNTEISNYKLSEFEDAMENFNEEGFYYDWSIWDYQKVHIGDKIYMIRTGLGNNCVVMRGVVIDKPYPDEDWSGKGRKVYYIRFELSHMIHPEKSPLILTADELAREIPDFSWKEGHSGELLNDTQAETLENVWNRYIDHVHSVSKNDVNTESIMDYFKEKGRGKTACYQGHGSHIETIMKSDVFIKDYLSSVGNWTMYDVAKTKINYNKYINEDGDILVVKKGYEMSMIALLLNNEKDKRIDFVSAYPMHAGIKHRVKIADVAVWKNKLEAVVYADMENISIAFFATDYYVNKSRYVQGAVLDIELAACAYHVEEGEKEIVLDAKTSEKMRRDMGLEPEYDEHGDIIPIVLHNNKLVAYLSHDDKYPDDAEFASPIESVDDLSLFGIDFTKAIISISHEPEETFIPLYFKKEWLPNVNKGCLLRGYLWMQGKIND